MPEGEDETVVRAARQVVEQRLAQPVLVGHPDVVKAKLAEFGLESNAVEIIWTETSGKLDAYADEFYRMRLRKGVTPAHARELMRDPIHFALMMVKAGDAEGFVGGMYRPYPETIRPALQIVGLRDGVSRVSALHMLVLKDKLFLCADTMVNIEPTSEELAEIAILAADTAAFFDRCGGGESPLGHGV